MTHFGPFLAHFWPIFLDKYPLNSIEFLNHLIWAKMGQNGSRWANSFSSKKRGANWHLFTFQITSSYIYAISKTRKGILSLINLHLRWLRSVYLYPPVYFSDNKFRILCNINNKKRNTRLNQSTFTLITKYLFKSACLLFR